MTFPPSSCFQAKSWSCLISQEVHRYHLRAHWRLMIRVPQSANNNNNRRIQITGITKLNKWTILIYSTMLTVRVGCRCLIRGKTIISSIVSCRSLGPRSHRTNSNRSRSSDRSPNPNSSCSNNRKKKNSQEEAYIAHLWIRCLVSN